MTAEAERRGWRIVRGAGARRRELEELEAHARELMQIGREHLRREQLSAVRRGRRWTPDEDQVLLAHMRLHGCSCSDLQASELGERLGRTAAGVKARLGKYFNRLLAARTADLIAGGERARRWVGDR